MEDDEEFSYSGYSKNTAEYIRANGGFTRRSGDESAFAAEIAFETLARYDVKLIHIIISS